ncbi:hypothetical protein UPYG_G00019130 [Umbra pygmaea]|uniref:Lymphocyte antigen 75 n=1 Tax=Umbra pygmaea TaxID=75934 RepID=A0ABD0XMY2_UMBPY
MEKCSPRSTVYLLIMLFVWDGTICLGCASSTYDDGSFTIQHVNTGKCLVAKAVSGASVFSITLEECDGSQGSQWKWGSSHHLFHVGTSQCLGLEEETKALSLFSCDSTMLWWRCQDGTIYTVYQMGLKVTDGLVSAKRDSLDTWRRDSWNEDICQRPMRIVYTMNGNSAGKPCEFPFRHNGSWYHECLPDNESPGLYWCATSFDYDTDKQMGYCLKPEEGCKTLFSGREGGPCYEFVSHVAVTWHEALDSCRSQGADLLSVSISEGDYFPVSDTSHDNMPDKMWIGLHHLDTSQGWQWSDGSPLDVLRWDIEMPSTSSLQESDCGVMNSRHYYESESCEKKLPYICTKNATFPEPESLLYTSTICDEGWAPWNMFCYKLVKEEPKDFWRAVDHCKGIGADLVSFHSLDTIEMVNTQFHSDGALDVWIGLVGTGNPATFKWSNDKPVSFTYWDRNQPIQPSNNTGCVSYSGKSHGWRVEICEKKLPFMCQKKGNVTESSAAGCPPEGDWKRHGNSCYKVDSKEVLFKDRCDVIINNRFEQAFINGLLGDKMNIKSQFYWIGLQDIKSTTEYQWISQNGSSHPVTYTNWGWFEPAQLGGCAVMSSANPPGKWAIKNCTQFKAGTICKRDIGAPEPLEPEPDPTLPCPDGWTSKLGISYCYKVFHEERLSHKRSWEEAERFCEALGAHLPSFNHPNEMRALHYAMRDSISDDRFFWVGLNRRNPSAASWEWSDNRPFSMVIFQQQLQYADDVNRRCAAFKTEKGNFLSLFLTRLHEIAPLFYATPFHCDARLEWVCQIPRGKSPKNPEWYNPGGHHDTSIFVDGKEFWFVSEPQLTFDEASLYCSSNESSLAAPESINAVRLIHDSLSKMSERKQRWWADMSGQGDFLPIRLNFSPFYHSRFLGRCTSITVDSVLPAYDYSCEKRQPFVCERHNTTAVEPRPAEPHPGGLPCQGDYKPFRNKCYTVIKQLYLSFKKANEHCQSMKGTLLTVADQVEQDFVTSLSLGLPEKNWIGLKYKKKAAQWVDATPVSYVNYNPLLHGQLRPMVIDLFDPDSVELCFYMFNNPNSAMLGTWDYTSCADSQYITICQHYADTPEEPMFLLEPFTVHNHTFKLVQKNLTWFEALEECRNQSMDLASVADTLQQSVLTVNVNRARSPMWIGLFSEDEGTHYRWTDHSHTVFSRWSSEHTEGRCVYLDTDGFWKATECEEVLAGAICHVPHEETITTPEDIAVKCPHKRSGPNWIPFKNNCYTFQLASSRWDEFDQGKIHQTCRKLAVDADIITIRNAEENEFVRQQLLPFTDLVHFVWLGVFMDDKDNQMKWYDGTNVQYTNWTNGRPTLKPGEEFLAGLTADGLWEIITHKPYFSTFKQRSIVACKLDKDTKEQYKHPASDYERYGNLSYHVITKKLTWFQALEECGRHNGHLASVHDAKHKVHMEVIAKRDGFPLWTGLSSQDVSRSQSYEWSDGTKFNYSLLSDSLGTSGSVPGCVYVTPQGSWKRTKCSSQVDGAICYNTTVTSYTQRSNQAAPQTAKHCPQGKDSWVEYQGQCYAFNMTFFNYSVYDMENARSICEKLDAKLLTIKTKEENDFVSGYMVENPLITSRVWLGMDLDKHGQPVGWVDGSTLAFSNWEMKDSATAIGITSEQNPCAVMVSADGGLWSRVSCKESLSRIVCKAPARSGNAPAVLVFFLVVLTLVLGAVIFVIYKKGRTRYSSTVRYKRTVDDDGRTSIMEE